jgi:hypothetical protein
MVRVDASTAAGVLSGIAQVVAEQPLDTIKVRLQ